MDEFSDIIDNFKNTGCDDIITHINDPESIYNKQEGDTTMYQNVVNNIYNCKCDGIKGAAVGDDACEWETFYNMFIISQEVLWRYPGLDGVQQIGDLEEKLNHFFNTPATDYKKWVTPDDWIEPLRGVRNTHSLEGEQKEK